LLVFLRFGAEGRRIKRKEEINKRKEGRKKER
jgi:hypothetical protein